MTDKEQFYVGANFTGNYPQTTILGEFNLRKLNV